MIEGHVWTFGMGLGTYDSISALMLYLINMPIFFFVSGYLAYKESLTAKQIGKKIWQKFLLLIIPAVIFKLFMDLFQGQNPVHVLQDGMGGYWFTITLFECFLIYYFVALLFKRSIWQMVIVAILAIVGIGLLSLYGEFGPKLLDMNRLTKYFQYFVFGLLAMRYNELYKKTMHNEWIKAGAIVLFFVLLFMINNPIWPQLVFHLLRDLVLRYLGTFVVVSFFVCNSSYFDKENRINKLIVLIGKNSLAIYLLQYFFIPSFMAYPTWVAGLDGFTVHAISFGYTVIITAVCLLFIEFISNSKIAGKYALGRK